MPSLCSVICGKMKREEPFEFVVIVGTGAQPMQPKSARAQTVFPTLRGIASVSTALVLVALLAGCPSRTTPGDQPVRPLEGAVVRVACEGEPAAQIVSRFGSTWASRVGARVEVVRLNSASGPRPAPPGDVWVLAPARLPHWAAAGQLLSIPDSYTRRDVGYAWENLLPVFRDKLMVWDGKVYALPLLGDALLCFYRTDLLSDPQHRENFKKAHGRELAPPATWQAFANIAEYFHKHRGPAASPSLPPLPENDEDLDRLFHALAAPCAHRAIRDGDPKPPPDVEIFSFHYDLKTGAVRVATPGFVRALEILQRLQTCRPASPARQPPESFLKGEAVLCLAGAEWIGRFEGSPPVAGKFGVCKVPGSATVFAYETGEEQAVPSGNHVPYLGADGWLMVVPTGASRPEAAFALIADLSSPKTSRDVVIEPAWGGGAFRREHFHNQSGWLAFGLSPRLTDMLIDSLRQTVANAHMINPVVRLRIPDETAYQQALVEQVRAALSGSKDPGSALGAVAEQWRRLDEGKDLKRRLSDYRLSIGLPPQP
jgi:multiple sugar transport system substrate-binding protein